MFRKLLLKVLSLVFRRKDSKKNREDLYPMW